MGAESSAAGVKTAQVLHAKPAGQPGQPRGLVSSVEWYPQDAGLFISADYAGKVHLWDTNAFQVAYTFDLSKASGVGGMGGMGGSSGEAAGLGVGGRGAGRGGTSTASGYSGFSVTSTNYSGQNHIYANKPTVNRNYTTGDVYSNNMYTQQFTPIKVMCARVRSSDTDRAIIACGLSDSSIKLCDTRTGDACLSIRGHTQSVSCVLWSPRDPHLLLSGSFDGTIKTWDVRHVGGVGRRLDGSGGEMCNALMSFDWRGDHTAVATSTSYDGTWDDPAGPEMGVAAAGHASKRYRMDAQNEALSKAHDGSVMSMCYSSCGNFVISAGSSSSNSGVTSNTRGGAASAHHLRLWSAQSGKLLPANYDISGGNTYKLPYEMSIAPFNCGGDDLLLYPMGDSGDIALGPVHASRGTPLKVLRGHLSNVTSVLYRGNEHHQIISAGRDGMIFIWEAGGARFGSRAATAAAAAGVGAGVAAGGHGHRPRHPLYGDDSVHVNVDPITSTSTSATATASAQLGNAALAARREVAVPGSHLSYRRDSEGGFIRSWNDDNWSD